MTLSTRLNNEQLLSILALSKDATAIYTGEDLIIEMASSGLSKSGDYRWLLAARHSLNDN